MKSPVTADEILRRGIATLPASILKWLAEDPAECQETLDGLDAHRDDAIAAKKALGVRLGEFDSIEAAKVDLASREADLTARVEAVAAAEAKLEGGIGIQMARGEAR